MSKTITAMPLQLLGVSGTTYNVEGKMCDEAPLYLVTHGGKIYMAKCVAYPGDVSLGNEMRSLDAIGRHENIVEILDRGNGFFVMPYCQGHDMLEFSELNAEEGNVCKLISLRETGKGLAHVHAKGYVHNDVKPGNMLLRLLPIGYEGNEMKKFKDVVLADFGICEKTGEKSDMSSTKGTVVYISPDKLRAQHLADPGDDVYSFGCTMFRMLSGKNLFHGKGNFDIFYQHLHYEPPKLSSVVEVPQRLSDLTSRCVRKKSEQRPPMQEVVENLNFIIKDVYGVDI
ncbi:MAG: protein kinase [Candidatus Aenigmatarchaeota archaeon]